MCHATLNHQASMHQSSNWVAVVQEVHLICGTCTCACVCASDHVTTCTTMSSARGIDGTRLAIRAVIVWDVGTRLPSLFLVQWLSEAGKQDIHMGGGFALWAASISITCLSIALLCNVGVLSFDVHWGQLSRRPRSIWVMMHTRVKPSFLCVLLCNLGV
jgi:hypothetical protein